MSLAPCSKAWPGRAHSWAQVLSSAPSLSTARGPVPCRGEPQLAGGSMSSRCLISWVWWCEDRARPAVEAFGPGSRCVANTADIFIPCTVLPVLGWAARHWISTDHAEALHPKAHSFTDTEGKEENNQIKKKKKKEKDQRMLNSTERATHGEESCFQEPQG